MHNQNEKLYLKALLNTSFTAKNEMKYIDWAETRCYDGEHNTLNFSITRKHLDKKYIRNLLEALVSKGYLEEWAFSVPDRPGIGLRTFCWGYRSNQESMIKAFIKKY